MNAYPHLFSPMTIRGLTFKNRIIAAPEGGVVVFEGGRLLERHIYRNDLLGRGNVAEILMGETDVSRRFARSSNVVLDLKDPEMMERASTYPKLIKKYDCVASVELSACGEMSGYNTDQYSRVMGPMEYDRPDGVHVYAMTQQDIQDLCDDFAAMALGMKQIGFDGVAIHAGHGWLFSQFLSPLTNRRTDSFGGSIENRSRISLMVLESIRKACGEDFLLECRVSGSSHLEGDYGLEDICRYCELISEYVDLIHVSAGHYRSPGLTKMTSTMYDEHGCNVEIAAEIKRRSGVAVAVVGGINDPDYAEEIIAAGKVDFVTLGRQLRCDPAFVLKAQSGKSKEIRRCMRCMGCFPGPKEECIAELGEEGLQAYTNSCSLNPYYPYSSLEAMQDKAPVSKNVLVIGGGVAGMQAAVTAADRGHRVTLVEKSEACGGILRYAADDPDKSDMMRLVETMEEEMRSRGVDVRCGTEADRALMEQLKPDAVIAAVGSSPLIPNIPGIHGSNVIGGCEAHDPSARIGEEVVIVGGGLVGCEAAVYLSKKGKKTTVIEMAGKLAPDAYRLHREKLLKELETRTRCLTNTKCCAILENGVEVETTDGIRTVIPADTVVCALGQRSNPCGELRALAGDAEFHMIGDCVRPRKIRDALKEGYEVSRQL